MTADPSLSDLREGLLASAADCDHLEGFLGDLEARGYSAVITDRGSIGWEGPTPRCLLDDGHTTAERAVVTFQPAWPYLPPLLKVSGVATWHANQDRLCLWREGDATRDWATVAGFMERVDVWSEAARDGFAGEPATLNPEVYWEDGISDGPIGLVDVDEFGTVGGAPANDGHIGRFAFTNYSAAGQEYDAVYVLAKGRFRSDNLPNGTRKATQVVGRYFFRSRYEIARPPTSWDEFRAVLDAEQQDQLDRDLGNAALRRAVFMLVWDTGDGVAALAISHDRPDSNQDWRRARMTLRPNGERALLLRAGPDAEHLRGLTAVVLGVGAIGSYVADLLARSGIGRLVLVDVDVVWPANRVRFAFSSTPIVTKTTAIEIYLAEACPWTQVKRVEDAPWDIRRLVSLSKGADVIVNATGDLSHAELTARACDQSGATLIAAALFRGGEVARVQRQGQGDTPLWERTYLDAYPQIPPHSDEVEYAGLETGCLAPVHNAPPASVARAATLAVEAAVDVLTGRRTEPDEVIEVIRPSGGWLDRPGRVDPSRYPVNVHLTETPRAAMLTAADEAHPNETGGVLLGLFDGDQRVITHAVEVPPLTPSQHRYDLAADAIAAVLAAHEDVTPPVGYVGSWHSHPRDAVPSDVDRTTFVRVTEEPRTGEPVFLIVAAPNGPAPRIGAYLTGRPTDRIVTLHRAGDVPADTPLVPGRDPRDLRATRTEPAPNEEAT